MIIEFDPRKNARNILERGLSFERVAEIDLASAYLLEDKRKDDGETRYIALCYLDRRLHVLCFSEINDGIRVIVSAEPTNERQHAMARRKPLMDLAGEVRELTRKDLAWFKPAAKVLSPALLKKLGVRGPQKAPLKERITIRLSPDIVAQFRDTGAGWQTRMDQALREWLRDNPLGP